jgi:HAD superfamily hydrolase (TIGR01549 family)
MLAEARMPVGPIAEVGVRGVANPFDRARRIRAVLFDLDGTLYRQRPMRLRMAIELAAFMVRRPIDGCVVAKVLTEYRRAQEVLRRDAANGHPLRQAAVAADRAGVTEAIVVALVNEWMIERPLKHLDRCQMSGLAELLSLLEARQIATGVLSDYPATKKLQALGIADRFSLVLCASDPEVGAFKPSPIGFLTAAAHWQIEPAEILYVGDRAEVDATGARVAGMPCVIVGKSRMESNGFISVSSFERLRDVLDDHNGH